MLGWCSLCSRIIYRLYITKKISNKIVNLVPISFISNLPDYRQFYPIHLNVPKKRKESRPNYSSEVSCHLIRTYSRKIYASNKATCRKYTERNFGEWRENKIFTVPNILCFGRILASPFLGYLVVMGQYVGALILFVAAGLTDLLDGLIARQFPSQMSYFGSVLDPIADKILVGVLTVSLCITSLLPVSLAVIILGRDIALIIASFAVRLISLPQPRNVSRFFDFQLPTVQVTPSTFGKVRFEPD
ncbi:probable cardiolipin synthase (CMP-forming) isoform X2 [Xenia sp. Carnegie-2017]|uniref:probable cardiolipin synthase (CMP-forming) isoform X2 n=1 Tax=Xenia sp. Carnegie-2017 TaxID=2897299 RepID=UPI001F034930|nr:probable cardiolipin synthase (CMP-forming) isoform X2 [Xenia sp. Carnegie-2017]